MGWKDDLYDASFRGVMFEVASTVDSYTKSIAQHQAPYSDDADIEDMGLEPRQISVEAMYSGEDYLVWTNALEAALATTGSGELIHPVYGILEVQVVSWEVNHNTDNVDFCSISIKFIKAKAEQRELFIPVATVEQIDTSLAVDAPAEALSTELKQLQRTDPNAYFNRIAQIRTGLQKAYQIINGVKKTVDNILSPADWAYGLVNDVARLVTFDVTDISAISKWRSLSKRIDKLSDIFNDEDDNTSTLAQLWRATTTSSHVAVSQEIVSQTRSELSKNNNQSSNEASMTPTELALIRQKVREEIQTTIRSERAVTEENLPTSTQVAIYKQYADQVHQQIQALIETRPPLITTVITQPCTAHLIAHQLYGDFTRSAEILRLNPTLENPAALRTGQELTVYAR